MSTGDLLAWLALVLTLPLGAVKLWKGVSLDDKYDVLEGLINITFCLGAVSWIVWKAPLVTVAVTCSLLAVSPLLAWLRQSLPKGEHFGVFPLTVSQLEDANDIAKINLGGRAIRFHVIQLAFSKNPFTTVALIDEEGAIAAYFDLFPVTNETYQGYLKGALCDSYLLPEVIPLNAIVEDSAIIFGGIATNPKARGQRSLRQIMQVFMLMYLDSVLQAFDRATFPFAIRPKFKGEHMIVKWLGLKCCMPSGRNGLGIYHGELSRGKLEGAKKRLSRRPFVLLFMKLMDRVHPAQFEVPLRDGLNSRMKQRTNEANKTVDSTATRVTSPAEQEPRHGQP